MKRHPNEARLSVDDQAARWVARMDAGGTDEDRKALESWLAADERHPAAYGRYRSLMERLSHPRKTGRQSELGGRLEARRARRRLVRGVCGAAAFACMLGFFIAYRHEGGEYAARETPPLVRLLLPERRVLPDGSVVELNADAEIRVEFDPRWRRVRLVRGEAHFQVSRDAARPFVVEAGRVGVRAVGTGFVVRHDARNVGVVVNEGVVRVEELAGPVAAASASPPSAAAAPSAPAEDAAPIALLSAGSRATVAIDRASRAHLAEPVATLNQKELSELQVWRQPQVEFSGTPLHEVVRVVNEQGAAAGGARLELGDPSLGAVTLSGRFRVNDPESLLRALELGFGLRADTTPAGVRVLRRRE